MSHRPPFQSLTDLPADIAKGFVDMYAIVFGLLSDELTRWRLVRMPARSFDPRNDVRS